MKWEFVIRQCRQASTNLFNLIADLLLQNEILLSFMIDTFDTGCYSDFEAFKGFSFSSKGFTYHCSIIFHELMLNANLYCFVKQARFWKCLQKDSKSFIRKQDSCVFYD